MKKNVSNNQVTSNSIFKNHYFSYLIVFSIPVLLYLQTLHFGFTHFDDDVLITSNSAFFKDLKNIPQSFVCNAFIQNGGRFYRPLQTVSFFFDSLFSSETNAWMFHFSNVILFGLIACSILALFKTLQIPQNLAIVAIMFFCVNPLFVSTVAWIPARGDLMVTLFSLLSFVCLIHFMKDNSFVMMILHWLTFTLALFSKETAAFLPFLFVVYFVLINTNKKDQLKYFVLLFLYLFSGVLWFWLRSKAVAGMSDQNNTTIVSAFLSNVRTFTESLFKFLIPVDFAPIPEFAIFRLLLGLSIIGGLLYLFFIEKRKSKLEMMFYLLWFIVLMLPPMFYKHPSFDYLDHRFMLPLIGILVLSVFLFPQKWMINNDIKKMWIPVIVIVILSCLTVLKSKAFESPMKFYNSVVLYNKNCSVGYCNRGILKLNENDYNGAIDDFNNAIAVSKHYEKAYYNRAIAKNNVGDKTAAISDYDSAIAINPHFADAYCNRGLVKKAVHDYQSAIDDLSKAIACNPQNSSNYSNRGTVRSEMGDKQGAISDFNKAIVIDPTNVDPYYNRANVLASEGKNEQAIIDFKKAIALQPNYEDAYINMGISFIQIGDYKNAIQAFSSAIAINPQSLEAFGNRAILKMRTGDLTGAIDDCKIVLQLSPNDQNARNIISRCQEVLAK